MSTAVLLRLPAVKGTGNHTAPPPIDMPVVAGTQPAEQPPRALSPRKWASVSPLEAPCIRLHVLLPMGQYVFAIYNGKPGRTRSWRSRSAMSSTSTRIETGRHGPALSRWSAERDPLSVSRLVSGHEPFV